MTDRALDLLAQHYGRPAGVLTASGAAAVGVALRRFGVCPGDEVIVPDHGCYKIAAAVVREGAVPVFAPVGRAVVLDPAAIGAALSTRTRCIVAVHQYGLPCPVGALRAALPSGIGIVEDAAQAWGTVGGGRPVGRDGDLVVTLYFENLTEAAQMAEDEDLVLTAHQCLMDNPLRKKLAGDYFLKSVAESDIYRAL